MLRYFYSLGLMIHISYMTVDCSLHSKDATTKLCTRDFPYHAVLNYTAWDSVPQSSKFKVHSHNL